VDDISDARDVLIADLDNGKSQHREVHPDNAATDRLPLSLAIASRSVARVAFGEQQSDTGRMQDTLLHRETLLVVSAGDTDNIALPLVAQAIGWNLGAHL